MLPAPVSTTINFDNVDASGGPITGAALDSFLNSQYGITITDITPSGLGEIVDDRFGFPGTVLRAFTDFNVFWHDSPNSPYSYTLNFAVPQSSFSFVRPELFGATPSGLIVSPWRARAFHSTGGLLDTVSEPQLAFFGSTPPVPFTLTGPGITSVIFDRTTLNTIAGLNRVPTDDWQLDVPTDPRREVVVGGDLMFGNAEALDYGDAPDPTYPTLRANDGARHVVGSGLFMGATVDVEANGQPDATATGDDSDGNNDDDGITLNGLLVPGQYTSFTIDASGPGLVDAWIDLDGDGVWSHPDEQFLVSESVETGSNDFTKLVPADATFGTTFLRFRISSAGGLLPTGLATDGEVEDYEATIETVNRFVVNSTGDLGDNNPGDGSCDTGGVVGIDPECTLRAAIEETNALPNLSAGPDVIIFDIAGVGPHTISPLSVLPTVTEPVVIDGTTEPDFSGATPVIEVEGSSAGAGVNGLRITAGASSVRGAGNQSLH